MRDDSRLLRATGLFTARVILGLIFGMAGYWKVFELTPIGHAQKLFIGPYANMWIPVWMLWTIGTVIPVIELVDRVAAGRGLEGTRGARRPGARAHYGDLRPPAPGAALQLQRPLDPAHAAPAGPRADAARR
jgi:hypothetical protein